MEVRDDMGRIYRSGREAAEDGYGSGGSGEGGFTEIAAEGGTAFGGGTVMEGAGEAFGGLVIITFTGMTGEDRKEGEKLPCPEFKGLMDDMFLRLEMQSVKDADGYEIDIRWEDEERKDAFIRWNREEMAPQISLLTIPVKGQVYLAVREGLTDEDLEGLLDKRIRLEGVTMDLKTKICEVLEAQKNKKLTNQEVLSEIAILLAANDPLKVAAALKGAGCTALEIAKYLVPWIPAEHKAAAVGAILLDPDIYPDTEEKEMRDILSSLCPDENIQQAIEILYPTYVTVKATEIWKDTGIDVAEDEIVTVEYLSGRWKVNPGHRESYDAEGNLETYTPYGYVLEHAHDGCLVGKVGDGEPFYIGKKQEVPRSSGRLYLIANDDIKCLYGVGHEDNEGEITIVIKKEFR